MNVKTYSDPDGIYEGEIGRIEGVRFVETSEAKVFTHAGKDYETGTTSSGTVTPKASAVTCTPPSFWVRTPTA